MFKLTDAFQHGKALIPFVTCGDPDLPATGEIVRSLSQNGADMVILGIPFSDPTAEGAVVEAANLRALSAGVTTDAVFAFVRTLRGEIAVPLVFKTYANVVFSYGIDAFCAQCEQIGIDGLIVTDVPFEEKDEFDTVCKAHGLPLISQLAPAPDARMEQIAAQAAGFLYLLAPVGHADPHAPDRETAVRAMATAVKRVSPLPCAVGGRISSPEEAKAAAALADGVIVGSAFINRIAQNGQNAAASVGAFARQLKDAITTA